MVEAIRKNSARDRANHDRGFFNETAVHYVQKDLAPASQRARLHRFQQTIQTVVIPPRASILEIGCGAGFAVRYLKGKFHHYVGFDHSEQLIALARRHNSGPGIFFETNSLSRFSSGADFDLIFMIGVLHHMDERGEALKRAVSFLKPGGWLVVNEPQPANPLIRLARWFRKRYSSVYSAKQDQLSARDLEELFGQAGLTQRQIKPQGCFSTPFAEVAMPAWPGLESLSRLACSSDEILEERLGYLMSFISWNLIAAGRRPLD